ncbi:MAG: hypothetical protein JJT88_18135 [Gammaproteobacteria bacterium]|nr:hypothetical protein [Gammaproteobacteria bacterium]
MPRPDRSSEGILTTQKLKALLESGLGGAVTSRTALAAAMCREGEDITVHGIDAWFKHVDSNYAIPRVSVDGHWRSYPIPQQRWPVLLDIFGIGLEDLDRDDISFRRWCFARRRAQRQRRPQASLALDVAYYCSPRAPEYHAELLRTELRWLLDQGCRIHDLNDPVVESDTAKVRVLQRSHLLLCHLHADSTGDPVCREIVDYATHHRLPLLLCTEPGLTLTGKCAPAGILKRPRIFGRRYQKQLFSALAAVAEEPMKARTQSPAFWQQQPPVTDRPSIAVLPFVNFTGCDEHTLFADSMTEDLTTLLARIPEFFVIAHATTRIYQHALPDTQTVRRELGVRYILEGSLRRAGSQLRINAQLVDAETGRGLWSQRFEHGLADPFLAQDELTAAICAQLEPRLRLDDIAYGARHGSISAWRLWQEGWHWLFVDAPAPMPSRSMACFEKALAREPDYGLAHAGISIGLCTGMLWGGLGPELMPKARLHAEQALQLLPEHPVALYAMGMMTFTEPRGLELPLQYLQRAVELEPSNAMYQGVSGYLLANLGQAEQGLERCRYAMRLSPKDAREPFLCYMLGNACIANGHYQEAITVMSRCRRFSEVDFIWVMMGFAYAQLGDRRRALGCLRQIREPRPYRFYHYAIMKTLWLGLPAADKEDYLALFPQADLGNTLSASA